MPAQVPVLPVVMAGGSGTRLWPLSRSAFPKQYQQLHPTGGSLFSAALRLAEQTGDGRAEVITNTEHRFTVLQQMQNTAPSLLEKSRIWTEPVGRNTCAVAALAACFADSAEVLLLIPADHYIADEAGAVQALLQGAQIAASGDALVVFGVEPTEPITEYGYIEIGEDGVRNFEEKPDEKTARAYCKSGNHLWNSGIFAVRADLLAAEVARHCPELWQAVNEAFKQRQKPAEYEQLPQDLWQKVPPASFDTAVVQRTATPIAAVRFDVGWSDLGSYNALRQASLAARPEQKGNARIGTVIAEESSGNYLHAAADRTLAVFGVENIAVVDTPDAVLVTPLDRTQELRQFVASVGEANSEILHRHRQDHRPWGHFRVLQPENTEAAGQRFQCKLLSVRPGASLSLQSHRHRSEHWVVVQGTATVEIDGEVSILQAGESAYIPRQARHRLSNEASGELQIVEVQIGDNLSEDDIVRYSDTYGRALKGAE